MMLTGADYRKRAHACIAAAQQALDRDAQLQWRLLANVWYSLAEQLGGGTSGYNETPAAVAIGKTSVIEGGERLRARLNLVN